MANTKINQNTAFDILSQIKKLALGIHDNSKLEDYKGFYVSFLSSGIPINKEQYVNPFRLGETGNTNPNKLANLSSICDLVDKRLNFKSDNLCVTDNSRFSEAYQLIINSAQPVPVEVELPDDLKVKLDVAHKLLESDSPDEDFSPAKKKYKTYKKSFNDALVAYSALESNAKKNQDLDSWALNGPVFFADVKSAIRDWEVFGKRKEIEDAEMLIASKASDAAVRFIAKAKANIDLETGPYKVQISQGNNILYTEIAPSNWCDPAGEGWQEYSFSSNESNEERSETSTTFGGEANLDFIFWGVSADGEHSETQKKFNSSKSNLSISFKYAVADINRPWLDTLIFRINNWYIAGQMANAVSDSSEAQLSKIIGVVNNVMWLPTVTTKLILVKDLFITSEELNLMDVSNQESTKIGGGMHIWNFSLGGDYKDSSMNGKITKEEGKTGISIKGIQLIGFISEIIPSSPKMDSPTQ